MDRDGAMMIVQELWIKIFWVFWNAESSKAGDINHELDIPIWWRNIE